MTRKSLKHTLTAVVLTLVAGAAYGQDNGMTTRIPFAFRAAGSDLPAGRYRIGAPTGTPSGTTAVVTPVTLTTSQSSAVLDGSGSTSASGNLQYLFTVVPGGLQPALLQSPSDPKATAEFVHGAGLYLVQLTVTDSSGNTSKSPVVMLNYQPSGNTPAG